MRGQMTALFLIMYNVIGFGMGPTVVALLTDQVFGGESLLRWSLVATVGVLGTLGTLALTLGLRAYGPEVARARHWQ
jgi:hypothetical protein